MNKYPGWLNALVVIIIASGIFLATPNLYGTAPAVQLSSATDDGFTDRQLEQTKITLENAGITPEAVYLQDERVVVRLNSIDDQKATEARLDSRFGRQASVALTEAPKLPDWMRSLNMSPMSLGLDLRGGVYVLLEVDMETALTNRLEAYEQDIFERLRSNESIRLFQVVTEGDIVRVSVEAGLLDEARNVVRQADPDLLVGDGADGRSLLVRMSPTQIAERQSFALQQNVTTIRNRIDQLGVAEPVVQQQGANRIVVQLPGVQDPSEFFGILTATATIEYRMVDESGDEPGSRFYNGRGSEPGQILKRKVIASGDQIVDATAGTSAEGQPAVHITLDSIGGAEMLENTKVNVGKLMSTVYITTEREQYTRNGETRYRMVKTEEIINTATIQGVFKNKFQTTGLSSAEAARIALLLRAGALAAPVYMVDERTIGPTLGQENIDRGFKAVQIGFIAVIVFMAVYYRWFGMIANLALLTNLVFMVAMLSLLGASLTLPGIAGIVLTVGMAVDANVLIFERIREQLSEGKSVQVAIDEGYGKALSSIADANITTFIAAVVLFAFGTGPIKGFAVTLAIGIATSMFTAIVGTRAVVNAVFGGRRLQTLPI
ncbi:MAG: protein translocase subunit SecD [Pseudomonadota bacterium]